MSSEQYDDNNTANNQVEYMIDKSQSRSSFDSGHVDKLSTLNRINNNANGGNKQNTYIQS